MECTYCSLLEQRGRGRWILAWHTLCLLAQASGWHLQRFWLSGLQAALCRTSLTLGACQPALRINHPSINIHCMHHIPLSCFFIISADRYLFLVISLYMIYMTSICIPSVSAAPVMHVLPVFTYAYLCITIHWSIYHFSDLSFFMSVLSIYYLFMCIYHLSSAFLSCM